MTLSNIKQYNPNNRKNIVFAIVRGEMAATQTRPARFLSQARFDENTR